MNNLFRIAATIFLLSLALSVNAAKNIRPEVVLTGPADGTTFYAPASIRLEASAQDADGVVTQVEFKSGKSTIAVVSQAPFVFDWEDVAVGTYTITAVAKDNRKAKVKSAPITIVVESGPPNLRPSISLVSPPPGSSYIAPATVSVTADTSDADGTISKVDFFHGDSLIGTTTISPFTLEWTEVQAGRYSLSARATDDLGASSTSNPVDIVVEAQNQPPLVAITQPGYCTSYDTSSNIRFHADALDRDGRIERVDFYAGSSLIATVLNPNPYTDTPNSYSFSWSGMAAGQHAITAVATDNRGGTAISAPLDVVVAPENSSPNIQLTAPTSGQLFGPTSAIRLTAEASDEDGYITRVDFYRNGIFIGTVAQPPYEIDWTGPKSAGQYSLTASATDDRGVVTTSAPVSITVVTSNTLPTVALTDPVSGSVYAAPAGILLTADATDADGTVAKVEFLQGQTVLAIRTVPPYFYQWNSVPVGDYQLTARATDDLGEASVSEPVDVSVVVSPPVIVLEDQITAVVGTELTLDASQSHDPVGGALIYRWFDVATGLQIGNQATLVLGVLEYGVKSYRLEAEAESGLVSEAIATVTAGYAPVAQAPVSVSAYAGTPVEIDGSASSVTQGTLSFEWRVDGQVLSTDPVMKLDGFDAGTYTAELTVTTELGLSDTATVTLNIHEGRVLDVCPIVPVTDDHTYLPLYPGDNILWTGGTAATVAEIEQAFNFAREQDPSVFTYLVLPAQAEWDAMSLQAKGLYLINAERTARGVKPYVGADAQVAAVAQYYADYIHRNNQVIGHYNDGQSPEGRLDSDAYILNNRDAHIRSESVAAGFGTGSDSAEFALVKSIYMWLYQDKDWYKYFTWAEEIPWVHRDHLLQTGLDENNGAQSEEGLIGFGVSTGAYSPGVEPPTDHGYVTVFNTIDQGGSWDLATTETTDISGSQGCNTTHIITIDHGTVPTEGLAYLRMEPGTLLMVPGGVQPIQVTGVYDDGSEVDFTPYADYLPDLRSIVSVDLGQVNALQAGDAQVIARVGGIESNRLYVRVRQATDLTPLAGTQAEPLLQYVPSNATVESYDALAMAVYTGRVLDWNGVPLEDVQVSFLNEPGYGSVPTGPDGRFIITGPAGEHTLIYEKPGYLVVQRSAVGESTGWATLENVTLLARDTKRTRIDLLAGTPQVHQSTLVQDAFGARRATVVFNGINSAVIRSADGAERPLKDFWLSATEFETPASMPGALPPETAFTYATDLHVAGGHYSDTVVFDSDVVMFVDNFLGFPVGEIVPIGYFDRLADRWVASSNGVVVQLVDGDSNGVVDGLDYTGDGVADDVDGSGATTDDAVGLFEYSPGATLWWGSFNHFTPVDYNWGSTGGDPASDTDAEATKEDSKDKDCAQTGSYAKPCQQSHHEDIPIAGTDIRLHYSSQRTEGYRHQVRVRLSGDEVPASVQRMIARLDVAGRVFEQSVAPAPNREVEFIWDGTSAGGDRPEGIVSGRISIGYEYPAEYLSSGNAGTEGSALASYPTAWASTGSTSTGVASREDPISWQGRGVTFKNSFDRQLAEGWSLSAVHEYDPAGTAYLGDGRVEDVTTPSLVLKTGITYSLYTGDDGYYQRGGSSTDYTISAEGTLIDRVTGLEWEYVDFPERFRTLAEAAQYCADATGIPGGDWRLPTPKEVGYTINKSGSAIGPVIYDINLAGDLWSDHSGNSEGRLKPVVCVRGEPIDQTYITELKRDATQEVVLDQQNGLMWQDVPENETLKLDWTGSIDYCEASTHAGYDDWRLPNINELLYVLPNSVFAYQTELVFPPGEYWSPYADFIQLYWSSTSNYRDDNQAWGIESESYNSERFVKTDAYHVRCVRDAASAARMPYRFDYEGRHVATVDADSGQTLLEMTYSGDQVSAITDRFGNSVTVERDLDGTPVRIVGPDGEVTTLTIDANGHLRGVAYEDGGEYLFDYSAAGQLTNKTTPNNHLFTRVYDANGRLTQSSDPEGGQWNLFNDRLAPGHDLYGYTTAENDRYEVDRSVLANGDIEKITTQKDGTQVTSILQADYLKETVQACGVSTVTDNVRDPKTLREIPNVITVTQPSGLAKVTTLVKTYAENGADTARYTLSADSGLGASLLSVDTRAGLTAHTSAEGRTLTEAVDPATLLVQSHTVAGLTPTTYTYDARGRLSTETTGDRVTQYIYNAAGRLETVITPDQRSTTYEYDALGRITRVTYPDGHSTQSVYDQNGNRTMVVVPTPANHDFVYNGVDWEVQSTAPLNAPTQYEYDRDKRLTAIVLPSLDRIEHTYSGGQLTQTTTPEGIIGYSYLCGGRLDQITEGTETLAYTWDGDLLTQQQYGGELNESIAYGYNSQFRVNQLTYAGASTPVIYENDGLLTGINGFTVTRHAEHGLPTAAGDGVLSQSWTYTGYGEAETVSYQQGVDTPYDYWLSRNDLGQITARQETLPDGTVNTYAYGYDNRRRLTSVHRNGALVETYAYDANGNRTLYTSTLRGRTDVAATYNLGDQLQSMGASRYAYDANGRLSGRTTGGVTTTYQYSSLGRLLQVQTPDHLIEYRHNALGNRVAKVVDGQVVEKYLWKDLTTLLATYDGAGNLKQRFEYTVGHTPTKFTQAGQTYYILTDHLGSPRVITDANGAIIKEIDYDAYGNVIQDSNPAFAIPFGFAGGLYDPHTGLIRFGYRDYDPDSGRWTARDPIGFTGGDWNLYTYAVNDPTNFTDARGLSGEGINIVGVILPAHTAPFTRNPIGGSDGSQIRYANTVNKLREVSVKSGHFIAPKFIDPIITKLIIDPAADIISNNIFPSSPKEVDTTMPICP